tara:strand:+ start:221 stop:1066 length:846 start_codon:yes stop_codon:yes gene_type:complete
MKVFIQSNKFQNTAAQVSKYSFEKFGYKCEIISFEDFPILKDCIGRTYLRKGEQKVFRDDLQSFTLLRFLIPTLVNQYDKILIIDPDIFALKSLNELDKLTSEEDKIYCTFYNQVPRSEMMVGIAKNFNLEFNQILKDLFDLKIDYNDLMSLDFYNNSEIGIIPNNFNEHDSINSNTFMLHTTKRITQPWKNGLDIDFERHNGIKVKLINYIKKFLFLKYNPEFISEKYIFHKNKDVYHFILNLFVESIKNNYLNIKQIEESVDNKFIGKIFYKQILDKIS